MSTIIRIPNAATVQLVGFPQPIKEWRESRKVARPGAEFTKAYKHGWDGYARPGKVKYNKKTYQYTLTLGRGWLVDVLDYFSGAEVEVGFKKASTLNVDVLKEREVWDILFDYQKASIVKIAENRWGRVAFATNAGKGAIIALTAVAALPSKSIILADEITVFDALVEEVKKWAGIDPGLVESGAEDPPTEDIVVAMVPTLRERLKKGKRAAKWHDFLESFNVALLDEADRATADTWKKVAKALINTEYRAGFSGSFPPAGSSDDFDLMGILGPTLIRVKNKELIRRDISAKPLVQLVKYTPPDVPRYKYKESGPEHRRWVYQHAIVENVERHKLVLQLLHPTGPNAIIVNRIQHGEELQEWIPDSIFLSGSDSKKRRREVLDQFKAGEFQNLIATRILDRGTNLLGNAVCLVFASAEGSSRQTLQRIGRGLRKGDDKEFILIRDIMDRGYSYLDDASNKRLRVYKKEGFDVEIFDEPSDMPEETHDY